MAKPGHRIHLTLKKLKMAFRSRSPHRRPILKDWENKSIVASNNTKVFTKTSLTNLKIPILSETRETKPHVVFKDSAVKVHSKVGTSVNGNPRQ